MKRKNLRAMLAVVIGLCASVALVAQSSSQRTSVSEKYIISAKAGGVNYVEGGVTIIHENSRSGVLLKGDQIDIGDRVTTNSNGRVEILLNPGSYLRLGKNSSFEFGTTDLEDLQIRLDSGSAIFEVFAANEFRVSVFTPKGKVALVDSGIYRIDISPDGSGRIAVTKGKAEMGGSDSTQLKKGRTATIGADTIAIAKFDTGKRDQLDEWSRSRAKEMTKVTDSLRDRAVGRSLLNSFNRGAWDMFGSFGLWVYSPMYGRYCFLPFGAGWSSPYGYGYRTGLYWYDIPRFYNTPTYQVPPTKISTRQPNNRGESNDAPGKISTREPRTTTEPPPFTKVGRGRGDTGVFDNRGFDFPSERSTTRTSFPFPSSGAPVSVPSSAPPAPVKVSKRDN